MSLRIRGQSGQSLDDADLTDVEQVYLLLKAGGATARVDACQCPGVQPYFDFACTLPAPVVKHPHLVIEVWVMYSSVGEHVISRRALPLTQLIADGTETLFVPMFSMNGIEIGQLKMDMAINTTPGQEASAAAHKVTNGGPVSALPKPVVMAGKYAQAYARGWLRKKMGKPANRMERKRSLVNRPPNSLPTVNENC